jgi:hypothetical protein
MRESFMHRLTTNPKSFIRHTEKNVSVRMPFLNDKNLLDKYGLEGWELVSVVQAGLEIIAYFKREKK